MLTKFLDPKNDIAFRKIFGTEKNKDILIHFLNDMILFKEKKPIKEVRFLKTVQDPDIASKKESIVDVLCEDEDKNKYIVEMQLSEQKGFEKRAQYYAAKAYISQMNRGDNKYNDLKEVIFLAIANFSLFPEKSAYKSDHVMLDNQTYENDLKSFSFTFLELAKFHKEKHELKTMIEKWAYFFKHAEDTKEDEINEIFKDDLVIIQAYEELNRFNWTEDELLAYEQEIKRILDNKAILDFQLDKAKQLGLEEGRAEGRAGGIAEGMEKGRIEGKEEGRAEEKTKIARKLLQQGFNFTEIKNIIDLTPEELESLLE